MAIVTLPNLGPDPFTVNASVLNGKVDPLATDYNGNIDDSNIVSGANIANAKLNLASISQAVTVTGGLTVSTTAQTMSAIPINEAKGADIASTTTPNITSATGNTVHITGTTTITGFATGTAGIRRILIFDGILTFTHNSTSLILPTGANITTAAGDTATMVSEGSGNWRCTIYQRKDGTPLISGFTPSVTNALSGSLLQDLSVQTGALSHGTTSIPYDDTIPQKTEGDQLFTLAIIPNNASNLLDITISVCMASDNSVQPILALFQDSTSNALAAVIGMNSNTHPNTTVLQYRMAAGTTSSTTFAVRVGAADTNGLTVNGTANARKLGGVCISSMTIREIKA